MTPATVPDARIQRHHGELVRFLERRCAGRGEELAQEVWLRLARARPVFADDAAFRAWMYTTARRIAVDAHRRRAARPHLVAVDDGPEASVHADAFERVATGQMIAVVQAALDRMKPELAEVFLLRTQTDLPFAEIARRQGTGLNTALGRMHQATRHLHQALHDAGLLPEGSPR